MNALRIKSDPQLYEKQKALDQYTYQYNTDKATFKKTQPNQNCIKNKRWYTENSLELQKWPSIDKTLYNTPM